VKRKNYLVQTLRDGGWRTDFQTDYFAEADCVYRAAVIIFTSKKEKTECRLVERVERILS
jgi:hypothetical protein